MSQFMENLQYKLKTSSSSLALTGLRLCFGAFLGLTLALIGERLAGYGSLSFTFVIVISTMVFMRISKAWSPVAVLVFSLICVLIGLLLRMYILLAPGA
jgi:hypothetical protein